MFHFLFIAALSRSWWPTATKLRPRPWPCATSAERIMTREYESLSPQSVSDFWKGCLNQKAIWYSRGDVACTFLWKSYWCITTDFSGEWCEWKPPAVLGSILFSFNQKSNFYFKLLGTPLFLLWSFEHQRHIHDYLDVGKGSIFWTCFFQYYYDYFHNVTQMKWHFFSSTSISILQQVFLQQNEK